MGSNPNSVSSVPLTSSAGVPGGGGFSVWSFSVWAEILKSCGCRHAHGTDPTAVDKETCFGKNSVGRQPKLGAEYRLGSATPLLLDCLGINDIYSSFEHIGTEM